jgi:hypothetical protein
MTLGLGKKAPIEARYAYISKVWRCRLTVSTSVLKGPMVSALEARI